jgi:hypothetical protein
MKPESMSSLAGLDFLDFIIGYRYIVPMGQILINHLYNIPFRILNHCPFRDKIFLDKNAMAK